MIAYLITEHVLGTGGGGRYVSIDYQLNTDAAALLPPLLCLVDNMVSVC
jgi:hypothetical protein